MIGHVAISQNNAFIYDLIKREKKATTTNITFGQLFPLILLMMILFTEYCSVILLDLQLVNS